MCPAGLYVHIPFCLAKCAYCDFVSFPNLQHLHHDYVVAVIAELEKRSRRWSDVVFDTLYVGGGTPTCIDIDDLAVLVAACRQRLSWKEPVEATVEANPGTVDVASLRRLRHAGLNRISLGVQSFDDRELRRLGRVHDRSRALKAVAAARTAGFANLSLDLMYGLPQQTMADWERSLLQAMKLVPEHISLYALTLEEGTPLAASVARGEMPAPDDDLAADMYGAAEQALADAGYVHYEISNWARRAGDGRALQSRHNTKYWRGNRYLGLGAAATSFDGSRRCTNGSHVEAYMAAALSGSDTAVDVEELDVQDLQDEAMMLGLRMLDGVRWTDFRERFHADPRGIYGQEIADLVDSELLLTDDTGLRLTPRGRLLGNRVFAAFLR